MFVGPSVWSSAAKVEDDGTVRAMMETIEREVEQEEYVQTEMPFEWIAAFDELRRDKRTSIHFDELQSLARKHGLPAVEGLPLAEEVKCLAKVFSGLGFIMYHDEPSLSHLVVLNPAQFLIHPATRLVCQPSLHVLEEHKAARREHPVLFNDYESMGIFDSRLFVSFWEGIDNHKELQVLMIKFGLLVPILPPSSAAAAPGQEHRYFIPALLPKDNSAPRLKTAKLMCFLVFASNEQMDRWERTGHMTLNAVQQHGFFPSGLFSRLLGKAMAKMQETSKRSVEDMCITANCAHLAYGGHMFRLVNLRERGCVRIDVLVESSQLVMRTLLEQARAVLAECVKNLRCNIGVPEDGGAAAESQNDYRDWKGRLLLLDGPKGLWKVVEDGESLTLGVDEVPLRELRQRFEGFLPQWLHGLLEWYHAFLSYRWTQGLDDEIVEGLFYTLSDELIDGKPVRVFLDRRRLEDGRNFVKDFAQGLTASRAIVPVVSHRDKALERMFSLERHSPVDNLLFEWMLSIIALDVPKQKRKLQACFPIMFGSKVLEQQPDGACVTSLFEGKSPSQLPTVVCDNVLAKAQELGGSAGAGAELTVHAVVDRVLKYQGHKCWETRVAVGEPNAEALFKKQLIAELKAKVLKVLENIPRTAPETPAPTQQPTGLQERCKKAEQVLLGEEGSGAVLQRIKGLEKQLFGHPGQGTLVERLEAIEDLI